MVEEDSTAQRRELGEALRIQRELAGITRGELIAHFDWSASKFSRLEAGKRGISESDVTRFLGYCRTPNDEVDRLLGILREPDTGYWARPHSGRFADSLRTLLLHETTACTLASYDLAVVPPLLQTESYARALLGPEADPKPRLARQAILPSLAMATFYIHEAALRAQVGSPLVMRNQLELLARRVEWARCRIRVLPLTVSAARTSVNAFTRLTFRDHRPVVHVELETASLFLEHPSSLDRYETVLDTLRRLSLGAEQSRDLLRRLACGLEPAVGGDVTTNGDLAGCGP
ncbi:helix-turn-helix domain-containing protein [Crossiella sp. CA198]|uniref:helix-turn-helix domain-containing protein n=1 Tax=Crossiella sp. CA198 TaxID=3455607 RepID=UPI003F8D31FF